MNLDKGICSVFRKTDISGPGEKPSFTHSLIYQSWYGEMSFETNPARPTENRRELRTDNRVRVLQNRDLKQNDVVVLRDVREFSLVNPETDLVYQIQRAYHGMDDDGPTPVTDLTLTEVRP